MLLPPVKDTLRKKMLSLYKQSVTGACTIQAGTKAFTVDKNILMAHSPVFERMLTTDLEEARTGVIKIADFSSETVEVFVDYIYSLDVENLGDVAETLFELADKYQVAELKDRCLDNLVSTLDRTNLTKRMILAFMHNDEKLKDAALNYVTKQNTDLNFQSILMSDEWRELLINSKDLAISIMEAVFDKTTLVLKPQFSSTAASMPLSPGTYECYSDYDDDFYEDYDDMYDDYDDFHDDDDVW